MVEEIFWWNQYRFGELVLGVFNVVFGGVREPNRTGIGGDGGSE